MLTCFAFKKHGVSTLMSKGQYSQINQNIFYVTDMPFAFCTREKNPWCEYAEDAETGPTTRFLAVVSFKFIVLFNIKLISSLSLLFQSSHHSFFTNF